MTLQHSVTISTAHGQPQFKHVRHNCKNPRHLVVYNIILIKVDGLFEKKSISLNSLLFTIFS